MNTIQRLESEVRSYCRTFSTTFTRAQGALQYDTAGRRYIDFFAGAGALNYGHNNPHLKQRLLDYIEQDGVTHALDMTTEAKCAFLEAFDQHILSPRGMSYRMMFPGPTGTNAVESALKLARKVTGRTHVVTFTNGFHGMTLGALAVTGNAAKRAGAGIPLNHVIRAPFDRYQHGELDSLKYLEQLLNDQSSGVDAPAAFIVETIQAEGGVNVASFEWLQRLQKIARAHGALLIVDDIQVGCGRTGPFFSFEARSCASQRAGACDCGLAGCIQPDLICLSKSLSGMGLPLSLVLIRPDLDVWEPGEHNGTFRGFNHAFVTATAAIETYWHDHAFAQTVRAKAHTVRERLQSLARRWRFEHRGRGMIQGLVFQDPQLADAVVQQAFRHGLIIETAGARGEVVKFLAPLTIDMSLLDEGLDILAESIHTVMKQATPTRTATHANSLEVSS